MARVNRTRKQRELFLIREFCGALGYRHFSLRSSESPDAFLYIRDDRVRKIVGIEQTDYFNDTVHGRESPSTPIAVFWNEVQASLMRRISHRRHLAGIQATVCLKAIQPDLPQHARSLAKELIVFVEAHPAKLAEWRNFDCHELDGYERLQASVSSLFYTLRTHDHATVSRCSWSCSNLRTGSVAIALDNIKSAVQTKNERPQRYDWADANERWLLISAASDTVSRGAGPADQNVDWDDPGLRGLCGDSPFDHIVFWERVRSWYKWLKPALPIVQYEEQRRSR